MFKLTATNAIAFALGPLLKGNCRVLSLLPKHLRQVHFTAKHLPPPLIPSSIENEERDDDQLPPFIRTQADTDALMEKVAEITLKRPFELHHLSEGPSMDVSLSTYDATVYYYQMQSIRSLEVAASQLYRERMVRGFCHLYTGQEACAVGMRAAMRPQDNVITAYRVHGWAYLMGISAASVLAELTGKQTGCALGKGGSMHMYAPHFYGGNGIVGAQVPLGAGLAFASKYRDEDAVCLALYGDGAANQGQVFESFNMAALWKLPMVFVCENNNYGMGTSVERAASNTLYYTRGDTLPGIWVDGMDVLAVRSATEFAIEFASTRGPLLLELCTYRYGGHSMSDPGTSYRSHKEVQRVRRNCDAIKLFSSICKEHELLTKSELKLIDKRVRAEVEEAKENARNDSELQLHHLCADVYANNVEPKMRGVNGFNYDHYTTERKRIVSSN